MPEERKCPDCREEMVEGFILDMTYGGRLASSWVEGQPERSIWTGVKIKDRVCRTVEAYRCPKCGLLKSYATTEIDP